MKKALFVFLVFYLSCDFITDLELPGVTIVSPSDGDTLVSLGQLEIRVEIQASDNSAIDHINLFLDDNLITTLTEFPYTTNISDTSSESHSITLKAKAYDKGGNWKESEAVSIYVVAFEPYGLDEVGNYDTPGFAFDLQIVGNYAYVADYDGGLRIIDISNPTSPNEVGYYDDNDRTYDVYVSGNYAYIANYDYGLRIINISNPSSPYQVGYLTSPWEWSYGLTMVDSIVYQGFRGWGFSIISVSDPSNPQEIGRYGSSGWWGKLIKFGNYVYIISQAGGYIFDISDPTDPLFVKCFDSYLGFQDDDHLVHIAKESNYLFTYDFNELKIFNVSDLENPVLINEYNIGYANRGYGIAVKDSFAYVTFYNDSDDKGGILEINVSNLTAPYATSFNEFNTPGYDVVVKGNYAYVACGTGGLRIFRIIN